MGIVSCYKLHMTLLTAIFDVRRVRLSLAESCAQSVHSCTFPLFYIKDGGQRRVLQSICGWKDDLPLFEARAKLPRCHLVAHCHSSRALLC